MPVADVALLTPLHVHSIAVPTQKNDTVQITLLSDIDLNHCVARLLHNHFDVAKLNHLADLSPYKLEALFDEDTLAGAGVKYGLRSDLHTWEPIHNANQFAFAMSLDQSINTTPPATGFPIETWRRTLLQTLVQNAVTRAFGPNVTTIDVRRLVF